MAAFENLYQDGRSRKMSKFLRLKRKKLQDRERRKDEQEELGFATRTVRVENEFTRGYRGG